MSYPGETICGVENYLSAAAIAVALLRDPAVAQAWGRASALERMTVGGLAAHLSQHLVYVPQILATTVPDGSPITLLEHYSRVKWRGADLDQENNAGVREHGEDDPDVADLLGRNAARVTPIGVHIGIELGTT